MRRLLVLAVTSALVALGFTLSTGTALAAVPTVTTADCATARATVVSDRAALSGLVGTALADAVATLKADLTTARAACLGQDTDDLHCVCVTPTPTVTPAPTTVVEPPTSTVIVAPPTIIRQQVVVPSAATPSGGFDPLFVLLCPWV